MNEALLTEKNCLKLAEPPNGVIQSSFPRVNRMVEKAAVRMHKSARARLESPRKGTTLHLSLDSLTKNKLSVETLPPTQILI